MKKIRHDQPITRENIRITDEMKLMHAVNAILNSSTEMSFDQALRYLKVTTKSPIHKIRKKLVDTYRMMGIVIDFTNTIPRTDAKQGLRNPR